MLCKICGRDNPDDNKFCYNCGSDLNYQLDELQYYDIDDSNEGFSRQDSKYIRAHIITEEEGNADTLDIEDHPSYQEKYIPSYLMDRNDEEIPEEIKESGDTSKTGKSRKSLLIKAFIITAALCLFAFIPLRLIVTSMFGLEQIDVYSNKDTKETFVINTSGKILHKIKDPTEVYWFSPDDKNALLYNANASNINNNYYYVSSKNKLDLTNLISIGTTSNGKLLYETFDSKNNGQLNLYDSVKNISKNLENETGMMYATACFSPDGKSYAYSKTPIATSTVNYQSYIRINGGKIKPLEKNKIIFAISDDGKYKYFYKINNNNNITSDDGVTVNDNGEVTIDLSYGRPYFNKSMTELICHSQTEGNFIIVNGKKKILMKDYSDIISILSPKTQGKGILSSIFTKLDSFKNTVIVGSDNRLRYIDNNYQAKVISEVALYSNPIISKDGKQVMFMFRNQIMKYNIPENESEVIANGVEEFAASKALREVYYLKKSNTNPVARYDYELYYKNGKKEPVLLSSQVIDMQMNKAKDIVFFIKKNNQNKRVLCYSKNGKPAKEITDINNPASFEESNLGFFIKNENNGSSNLYYISKGTKIKLIYRFE